MRAFDAFSGRTQRVLRSMTLTRVQGAERIELERHRREFAELGRASQEMAWTQSAYSIVQGAVAASAGVVGLMVGGLAVAHGDMSLGDLLAFYAVLVLLLRQLGTVLSAVPAIIAGRQSLARVDALLAEREPEPYVGTCRLEFGGAVALDGVSFSYGEGPLLRGIDLHVAAGERVAVVGPNGAGKTTLLSLMLGLYRPGEGRVLADGLPLDELDLRSLRRRIGVVLQDPIIFPGTVAANISYGHPEATLDDIRRAARWTTADEFIEALPQGYDTEVGEEGGLLSGGQRQRIAIARALLHQAALLVLDEPTTHLDASAVAQLTANLRRLPGAPTLILISHDPEVGREVDRVYHLRDGRIAQVDGAPALRAVGAVPEGGRP
jgi:ABC-type bacteriocin/lantibiotic exporter with double-glycine peptidase domain